MSTERRRKKKILYDVPMGYTCTTQLYAVVLNSLTHQRMLYKLKKCLMENIKE